MKPFKNFTGIVVPLDRSNVDTDSIIPKQYLKSIKRTGFGINLFDEWRYLNNPTNDQTSRTENPDFILNQSPYRDAQILLSRANFGCGSSREHAVWSFLDYGIKVIIAHSFADIFYTNAFKNGLLLIKFDNQLIDELFSEINNAPGYRLSIDLAALTVNKPTNQRLPFALDANAQECLLNGIDDIDRILLHADKIRAYERNRKQQMPWIFSNTTSL